MIPPQDLDIPKKREPSRKDFIRSKSFKIPPQAGRLLNVSADTVRVLKRHELELNATLEGAFDPASHDDRTTFALQMAWEKMSLDGRALDGSLWHSDPVLSMEGRFITPFWD